jgi:hypothetical protein
MDGLTEMISCNFKHIKVVEKNKTKTKLILDSWMEVG